MIRTLVIAAVATAVATAPAAAQGPQESWPMDYKTSGLALGLSLNGTAATFEEGDETDSGGGIGFRLGYGFTPASPSSPAGPAPPWRTATTPWATSTWACATC
jgi:hypothetical protein